MSVLTLDGEEVWHADFARETGVDTLPDFVQHISFEGLYSLAVGGRKSCKDNLPKIREGLKDFPTALGKKQIRCFHFQLLKPTSELKTLTEVKFWWWNSLDPESDTV